MPDYASILRRSVSALPDPSPEMREAVYQRARAALARQLTAVDPPLSTREIESQHQELEDAVVRLEAEYAPDEEPASSFGDQPRKDDFLYSPPPAATPNRREASSPMGDMREAARAGTTYEDEEDDFDDDDRSSRVPVLIGLLCVVLVVLGAGAYVYAERDTLFGFLGSGAPEDQVASVANTPVGAAPPKSTEPDKRPDRLTNGSDAPPAESAPSDTAVAAAPQLPAPSPTAAATPEGLPLENLSSLATQDTANATPAEQPGTNLVEQKAIYYYQGSEGQAGQASQGTATWAEITKDGRPAIQATLRIPEHNVTATLTIYKNYDTTLPASHLVEIQFAGTLAGSPIQRVPALVLKQTEQARGQPLAGAAVPVTNELFWIALSDQKAEVTRNVQLLREGSWFDIPILFNDQTRALISFEKGIPGDKVFETVMASWTPS